MKDLDLMSFGAWPANMNFDTIDVGSQSALSLGPGAFATNGFGVDKEQNVGELREEDICVCDNNQMGLLRLNNKVVNIEMITSGDQKAIGVFGGAAVNNVAIKVRQC